MDHPPWTLIWNSIISVTRVSNLKNDNFSNHISQPAILSADNAKNTSEFLLIYQFYCAIKSDTLVYLFAVILNCKFSIKMDIRLIAGISALSVVIVMWLYYILRDKKYFLNLGKSK